MNITLYFPISYLQKPKDDFIRDYEVEFIKVIEVEEDFSDEILDFFSLYTAEFEVHVLQDAYRYLYKYHRIISKVVDRYNDKRSPNFNKEKGTFYLGKYIEVQSKLIFIERKLFNLGQDISTLKLIKNIKPSPKKDNLLIDGKKPNISERYKIANDTLDLWNTINNKNISATDKHILLAHILGCSEQVARELFNGTQLKRTPIRETLINDYLKKLNNVEIV